MRYNIYTKNESNTARFALGLAGTRPLYVFGINPSTASDMVPDRTMQKVEGFASRHGFDGFVMLNVYPHRATDSNDLPTASDKDLCKRNIEVILHHFQGVEKPVIWAAWGDTIHKRLYLLDCLSEIHKAIEHWSAEWRHCGTLTQSGNPRHPSRLGYANAFQRFDLPLYLRRNGSP